jgi:DNA repair ATPase RecN
LQSLQDSLSVNLSEGLKIYHQSQTHLQSPAHLPEKSLQEISPVAPQSTPSPLSEADCQYFASVVANQVLAYMLDNTLQTELHKLQFKLDEYYTDNREMAAHIRQLIAENEALKQTLETTEKKVNEYKHLCGKFYIKL